MTTPTSGAGAQWLDDPALAPVWTAVRRRLEGNGVVPVGVVTVDGLDRAGRHAVSGLVGRPVVRDRVRVDLAALDEVLRQRSGVGGLVAVVERLGGPVRNRVAERSGRAAAREAPYDAARAWLAAHPAAAGQAWVGDWLVAVRRSGALSRVATADAAERLVRALDIAAGLLGTADAPAVARTELAARTTGNAHALDDGNVLAHLVLRAIAIEAGVPAPTTAAARRALWQRVGVSADAVSSTCLTIGLRLSGDGSLARRLGEAADAGDPVHVTEWDLRRADVHPTTADGPVLVCENPRVLEAVAETYGGRVPAVCTSGMPGLVTLQILNRLAAAGRPLHYHGDFDWPGIAIANHLVARIEVQPWQMSADDYRAGVHREGPALAGAPVEPAWDASLGAAMRERGVAVHEESVLDVLVAGLARP